MPLVDAIFDPYKIDEYEFIWMTTKKKDLIRPDFSNSIEGGDGASGGIGGGG